MRSKGFFNSAGDRRQHAIIYKLLFSTGLPPQPFDMHRLGVISGMKVVDRLTVCISAWNPA